jgi:hypothetical protein
MKSNNLHLRKWSLLTVALFYVGINTKPLSAQQNIVVNKDNTRPETSRQYNSFNITDFKVIQQNGYNQVQWMAPVNDDGYRFIVEYSYDGVNFISGQRVLSNSSLYNYRHYVKDTRPLLYRVRTESITGSLNYSGAILPQGIPVEPVQIQKNVVSGNVVNVTAQFPVERVTIVSSEGFQQFAKDINGQRDFIPIAIPTLNRGVYFITFFGNGWKTTSRFVVG